MDSRILRHKAIHSLHEEIVNDIPLEATRPLHLHNQGGNQMGSAEENVDLLSDNVGDKSFLVLEFPPLMVL